MRKKTSIVLTMLFMFFIKINIAMADTCSAVFSMQEGHLGYYIDKAFSILQYLAPIIVILYGSFDLLKAVVASSEDKMKQAQKMIIKRIIIAICLFFVPFIVKTLLVYAGIMGCEKI